VGAEVPSTAFEPAPGFLRQPDGPVGRCCALIHYMILRGAVLPKRSRFIDFISIN
jgi:hypothetical protein